VERRRSGNSLATFRFVLSAIASRTQVRKPYAVSTLRVVALVALLASLAVAACEKPNDLPRLQDEAVATAKLYQQRLDELSHRAAAIGPRVAALASDAPDGARARQAYQQALATIEDRRRDLRQQLPPAVQAAMKSGNPEELARLIDRLREVQEHSATEATSKLSAAESWVAIAEQRQSAPRAAAPPSASEPPEADDRPSGSPAPGR
jgi:hypothetical protein